MIRIVLCIIITNNLIDEALTLLTKNHQIHKQSAQDFPQLIYTFSKCRWTNDDDCENDDNDLPDEQESRTVNILLQKSNQKRDEKNVVRSNTGTVSVRETFTERNIAHKSPIKTTTPRKITKVHKVTEKIVKQSPSNYYDDMDWAEDSHETPLKRPTNEKTADYENNYFENAILTAKEPSDSSKSEAGKKQTEVEHENTAPENLHVNNNENSNDTSSDIDTDGYDDNHPIRPVNKYVRSVKTRRNDLTDKSTFPNSHYNHTVADDLAAKVRVLCWVITCPENHREKALHVKNTWGKRCNMLLFMSTEEDKALPAIKLNVSEGVEYQLEKIKAAIQYIHEHHINDADWFLKTEDDTYVIVENLRYMLADYNTNDAIAFGCQYKFNKDKGYLKSGPGQVYSRGAIKSLQRALKDTVVCNRPRGKFKDIELGVCMASNNVRLVDSRDGERHSRFYLYPPQVHLSATRDPIYYAAFETEYLKMLYHNNDEEKKLDCCSRHAVSFHKIEPAVMYVMEYMIYHLRPYGIKFDSRLPPPAILTRNTPQYRGR